VNNSAAGENVAGGRPASARSRSRSRYPKRVTWRLPGEPEALAATSNRTTPQEGHYISSMDGRAKRRQHQKKPITAMNNPPDQESDGWLGNRGFGGLDWASQKHSIVVVDPQGKVVEDFEIEHSALGWKKFRERIKPYGSIPFAIETSQGAAVEQLRARVSRCFQLSWRCLAKARTRSVGRLAGRSGNSRRGLRVCPPTFTAFRTNCIRRNWSNSVSWRRCADSAGSSRPMRRRYSSSSNGAEDVYLQREKHSSS
jgi:hypothetical protein